MGFLKGLLLPPLILFYACVVVLLLRRWIGRPWTQRLVLLFGVPFILMSTPMGADVLQRSLEIAPPLTRAAIQAADAQAIVVLSGGRQHHAPQYGGETIDARTLDRLRYGVRLHRLTDLPILVTGGLRTETEGDIAGLMRDALETDFGITPRWVESRAMNTEQNARFSAEMLRADGVERIFLVTSAWHLRRATPLFEQQGLTVIPAGSGYPDRFAGFHIIDLTPHPRALYDSYYALYEWVGLAWYHLRFID